MVVLVFRADRLTEIYISCLTILSSISTDDPDFRDIYRPIARNERGTVFAHRGIRDEFTTNDLRLWPNVFYIVDNTLIRGRIYFVIREENGKKLPQEKKNDISTHDLFALLNIRDKQRPLDSSEDYNAQR